MDLANLYSCICTLGELILQSVYNFREMQTWRLARGETYICTDIEYIDLTRL